MKPLSCSMHAHVCPRVQVVVSRARQPAYNGVYAKQGIHDDRDAYQNASAACIVYNGANKSWELRRSKDIGKAEYSRQPEDDDIVPPNGEWRYHSGSGKCDVKAAHRTCKCKHFVSHAHFVLPSPVARKCAHSVRARASP